MTNEDDLHLKAFAALQEVRFVGRHGHNKPSADLIPASRIVAYARRGDSMADFELERTLRRAPKLRALYRKALTGVAHAVSFRAVAASGARVTQRLIGEHSLEIVSEADDTLWLVLRLANTSVRMTIIELCSSDGDGRRVALGEPIDGIIQLPLDPAFPELAGVAELIADPATEIYLL